MSTIHPYLVNGRQSDQSIYEVAASEVGGTGIHPVGTRASLEDGRAFYYARSKGAAIDVGKLLTAELATDEFHELAVGTPAVGDTAFTITTKNTAVTINEYAEGYAMIIDDTGEGYSYKIKSHPLAGTTASCILTLHETVQVALGSGATVEMVKPLWSDVIIAPTGFAHVPAGIAVTPIIAGTSNPQFFWCQTWGMAAVWTDEAVSIGEAVISGVDTAGQVSTQNAVVENVVGYGVSLVAAADGEYNPTFLTIAP